MSVVDHDHFPIWPGDALAAASPWRNKHRFNLVLRIECVNGVRVGSK